MTSPSISSLKRSLSVFINQVRRHYKGGHVVEDEIVELLETRYRDLYEKYRNLDGDTIHREFSAEQIKAINFLSLGESHARLFYREMASFFSEDVNQTAVAVAHFVKARRAYDLVNKSARSHEDNEELARMFGSILGVQVSGGFVAALRAEEMGRIIGYALSGLCESDMRAWNSAKTGPELRRQHGTLDQYLHHTIRQADKWASYRFENLLEEEGHFAAALKINEFEGAPDVARGRNLVDHCFVYHNPKGGGVITLGTSTVQSLAQEHGYSFAQPVLAAQALVAQKTINGEPNPYYGYEVQPYCFFAGHMPTTEIDGSQASPPLAEMLAGDRSASQGGITPRQLMELAWTPFFSLFASTNPSPIVGRGLEFVNPMIAGCETLPLYRQQVNEHRQKRVYSNSRRLATMVIGYAARVASILAQDNTIIDLGKAGPQKSLQPMLEMLLRITKNHFKNFPLMDNQSLSDGELKSIQRVGASFARIAAKLKQDYNHRRGDIIGALEEEADLLTAPSLLNRRLKRDTEWAMQFDRPAVYSEDLHNAIDSLSGHGSGQRLNNIADTLKLMIQQQKATPLFETVFNEIDQQFKFESENEADNAKAEMFWKDYKRCLLHALDDKESRQWSGAHHENWDALLRARASFRKSFPGHPVSKLVNATSVLISQKSPTGSYPLSERIEYPAVQSCLMETAKTMVSIARNTSSDILVADLRAMSEAGKSRSSAHRRRNRGMSGA